MYATTAAESSLAVTPCGYGAQHKPRYPASLLPPARPQKMFKTFFFFSWAEDSWQWF